MKVKLTATALLLASQMTAAWASPAENAPQPTTGVAAFLKALNGSGGKPLETLSPRDARAVLTGAQQGAALPPAQVAEKTITVLGKPLRLTIVKPEKADGVLPVFMFFHGGGWVLGDFPTHERLVRDIVNESGAAAVFVNYDPSPEAHYPVAITQAYEATKWVAAHGAEIGVDGKRLALVGNSVGGNMVAAVALQAKNNHTPAIRYDVMLWPVTDASFDTPSYRQFAEGYFLTRNMMKWFWDNYITSAAQRQTLLASPLRATEAQLAGLPPTLIQTAELDVLRDEGEAFGRKLDAAGVPVTVTRYNGMIHDFGLLNALSKEPAVRTAISQASSELKAHLK
ncbi:alpha/beta hydrolase [Candidatus Pantoea soli]|uniref:Alpha/beta hydrolase n=1 Tax=Candidatus Pantoea soli TaxID=3098669 RepID=A0A518XI39_9GAMM|nr:alpha/beta hydrolase [Pantoea soli]QDY43851.1 alpha/beta hydrolase [Pantoea soli]